MKSKESKVNVYSLNYSQLVARKTSVVCKFLLLASSPIHQAHVTYMNLLSEALRLYYGRTPGHIDIYAPNILSSVFSYIDYPSTRNADALDGVYKNWFLWTDKVLSA